MTARQLFLLRHLGPALPVTALLVALDAAGIDATVSGWFFDRSSGTFPLRHDYLLEIVAHHWAKDLVIAAACCVIALFVLSRFLPELRPWRRMLGFLSLAMTLAPLTVVLLKEGSARQCPWNLLEFGGFAPRITLLDIVPGDVIPGHCFPASHAAAGFCLVAFYFVGRAFGKPRLAQLGLYGGIAAGLALGAARVAQGAHYPTGVLWSGLVCWIVIVLLYAIMSPLQRVPAGARAKAQPLASSGFESVPASRMIHD